jgi:Tfp pilus assembly protein PilO
MADLRNTRKRFAALSVVLAVIIVLACLYLATPIGASNAELNDQLKQTNKELEIKEQRVTPLRGLPEKLAKTNEDITTFYRTRLPAQQSAVSEELGKLASAENITLSDVKYENFDTDISSLRAVVVEAQLSGEYSHLAKFINSVERDKMFLIVDGLSLEDQKSDQKGANTVRLTLRFGTCLRPANLAAAEPEKPEADDSDKAASDKAVKGTSKASKVTTPKATGAKKR